MRIYAVWYYDIIVGGPFAKRSLAKQAMDKIKTDTSCVHKKLRVGQYESEKDAQIPGGHWTRPSVLLLCARR